MTDIVGKIRVGIVVAITKDASHFVRNMKKMKIGSTLIQIHRVDPEKFVPENNSQIIVLYINEYVKNGDRCYFKTAVYKNDEFRWEGMLEPITDTILAWAYVPNIIYKKKKK